MSFWSARHQELSCSILYTNPEGVQYIQEEEVKPVHVEEQDTDGINTLHLKEQQHRKDYSEADFIPHPFLRMNLNQ